MKPWYQLAWWKLTHRHQIKDAIQDALTLLRDIHDEKSSTPTWIVDRARAVLQKAGEFKP